MTVALITGVAGQDGAYLAQLLRSTGVRVLGTIPPGPVDAQFVDAYLREVELWEVDLADRAGMRALLERERPDEIYNLAAVSSVAQSWARPVDVTLVNGVAVLGLLDLLRELLETTGYAPRLCHASSSEILGTPHRLPQTEDDPIAPTNPYGVAKALAHHSVRNYREAYGLFASTVILFNHESPLRPAAFVTRKITTAAVEIAAGRREVLELGRLDVRRDWGFAGDYVRAMREVLQVADPGDFVVATGESHKLGDFVDAALTFAGVTPAPGLVVTNPAFVRPTDVPEMRGDPSLAETTLGWRREVDFAALIERMVEVDRHRQATGVEHDPGYLLQSSAAR